MNTISLLLKPQPVVSRAVLGTPNIRRWRGQVVAFCGNALALFVLFFLFSEWLKLLLTVGLKVLSILSLVNGRTGIFHWLFGFQILITTVAVELMAALLGAIIIGRPRNRKDA